MKITFKCLVFMLFSMVVQAAEVVVLLPLTGPLTPQEKAEISSVLVSSLSARYELKYGNDVEQLVKKVFQEESRKPDCDEINCYRRIAGQYRAEKIISVKLAEVGSDHYRLVMNIYDVTANEVSNSRQLECAKCSLDKLKKLAEELAVE